MGGIQECLCIGYTVIAIDLQLQCLARAGINLLDRIQHGEVEGFPQGCAPWAEIKPFFQADLQIFVAFWSGGCTTPLVVTRFCIALLVQADAGGQHLKQTGTTDSLWID